MYRKLLDTFNVLDQNKQNIIRIHSDKHGEISNKHNIKKHEGESYVQVSIY